MTMNLRDEATGDIHAIHVLTEAAFRNAPHTARTEQFIVDALRRAGALTVSLVAEENGMIIGHVAISPVIISDGSPGWYGLGPISVSPDRQRQGIGSKLMTAALQRLMEMRASGCMLVGDPAFYSRFGFKPEQDLVFPGVPPEYFLVLSFVPSLPHGTVIFHDAFGAQQ